MPRYGITFDYDKNQKKFICRQFNKNRFYLSDNQKIPFLGGYETQIILENQAGEKKVLIPALALKDLAKHKKMESLTPNYSLNQHLAIEDTFKQKYYAFDVTKEGEIVSNSQHANLFLSYVLCIAQEYESAANYLRKFAPRLSAYTKEEEDVLQQIMAITGYIGDSSGEIISLRSYAAYLLVKNRIDHNREIPEELIEKVIPLVSDFMTHHRNITAFKFTREEEAFLLKFVLNREYKTVLFNRLNELDPISAQQYTKPKNDKTKNDQSLKFTDHLRNMNCPQARDSNRPPFKIEEALVTRLPAYFNTHFHEIYTIAKNGKPEEKKWLNECLLFSRHQGKMKALMGALLECVLENPGQFPETPKQRSEKWWDQILKIADPLGVKKLKVILDNPTVPNLPDPTPNITPADYRIEPEKVRPRAVDVVYKTTPLKSFKELCKDSDCFEEDVVKMKNGNELQDWFTSEIKSPASKEPLYAQEFEKLGKELQDFITNHSVTEYRFNAGGMDKLEAILQKGQNNAEDKLKNDLKEIIDAANCPPEAETENILFHLKRYGRTEKLITIDQLLVYYGRKDISGLMMRNPGLDREKINKLFDKVGEYLILKTHEQQRKRAQTELNKIKASQTEEEKHDLIQQLANIVLETRHYIPEENPAYLVFEYYSDKILRETQVKKLERLLKFGDVNPVMEMIMGSGKSKILMPLLGLLRADGNTLSTLIVPQPLFESISSDTQQILNMLGQSLRSLHFDRDTKLDGETLGVILDDLKSIRKNQECLIMTSKSVQCLMLKYIEKCNEFLLKGVFPQELQLMQEILSLLHSSGHPLIDEADTVLNVLHEVCFTSGTKASANPNEVKLIATIFDLIYGDPELQAAARLDSDPKPLPNAPVYTENLYHDSVKALLAKKLLQSFSTITFDSSKLTGQIQDFYKKLTQDEQTLVINYFLRDKKTLAAAQAFYDKQDDSVKNILALAAEELSSFLPHTLAKICDEKYGIDDNKKGVIAIPFAAANTPNSGSQFANPYITINYTLQYYSKKEITKEIILQQIERLQAQAISELKEDSTLGIESTKAWAIFLKLKGNVDIPLFNIKPKDIDKIVAHINSEPKNKRQFVIEVLLPQLELFTHKITCNPHNLVALFLKAAGFTGTLWNSQSMHSKLHPEPESGTDIKTIKVLWEHSRDEVVTIDEGDPEAMLKKLQEKGVSYDMISDAGGYFKKGGNTAIAESMAKTLGKPIVFYNKKNEQAETNGSQETLLSESATSVDKRNTFLDQSHTVGADVPQKLNAVGIVTIGRNMLERDLLQAVWRLRGLEKSQRIKFVLSAEVESIIRQKLKIASDTKIRFDDILRFTVMNQVAQQSKDNFKGLREELASEIQSILLKVLFNKEFTLEQKVQAFTKLKDSWIKKALMDPKDLYGTITRKVKTSEVIKNEKTKFQHILDDIYSQLTFLDEKGIAKSEIEGRVKKLFTIREKALPAKLVVPLLDTDSDQTVEQETAQERENELEVNENKQDDTPDLGSKDSDLRKADQFDQSMFESYDNFYFSMKDFCEHDKILKDYADAFEGIHLSLNALEWPKRHPRLEDLKLLGSYRTLLHFVQVEEDEEIIILGNGDAD